MITLLAKLLPAAWPVWAAEAIFWAVVAVGGTTAVALFWHTKVAAPYIAQGQAKQLAIDEPKIAAERKRADAEAKRADLAEGRLKEALAANATLQQSVTTLEAAVKDAKTSIERLKALTEKARAQARAAIAKAQAQAKRDADLVAQLTAVASGPPVAAAQVCAQAGDYLSELASWRRAQ